MDKWSNELKEFKLYLEMRRFAPRNDHEQLMLAAHVRMLEILVDGGAITPYPETHNP